MHKHLCLYIIINEANQLPYLHLNVTLISVTKRNILALVFFFVVCFCKSFCKKFLTGTRQISLQGQKCQINLSLWGHLVPTYIHTNTHTQKDTHFSCTYPTLCSFSSNFNNVSVHSFLMQVLCSLFGMLPTTLTHYDLVLWLL